MEVTTVFNPGDKVWVMKNNKPYQFEVHRIEITITAPCTSREMYIDHISGATSLDKAREDSYVFYECFATKRELLNSFLKEGE